MILSGRAFLLCVATGGLLGGGMILTHTGPGIRPLPPKSTPEYRNEQRVQIVGELAAALKQYHADHGNLPVKFSREATQICTSSGDNCTQMHLADMSFLTTGGRYVPGISQDPKGGIVRWGSGITIAQLSDDEIQITAPRAELDKVIETTIDFD